MIDERLTYFSSILLNSTKNVLIYQCDDGEIVLYEEYFIRKKSKGAEVYRYRDDQYFMFANITTAMSWAILDWNNKIFEAKRLLELDRKLSSIAVDIMIHKKLAKHKSLEISDINKDKLSRDVEKRQAFQYELDKYIILAKTCQQRGFENELNRTSRK